MNNYTIYCTEEQTKKALELGAPITVFKELKLSFPNTFMINHDCYVVPSAEQMIAWLEEQESISDIDIYKYNADWRFEVFPTVDGYVKCNGFNSRPEATLAAINAALGYLNKNEKNNG